MKEKKEKIAGLSVFANLILAIAKILVGLLTRSSAILAEGIHSGMDVFSSGISLIGIRLSKKPRDEKHPYGHYKFEVLTGLIITIILFITGIGIIYEAYKGFLNPVEISIGYLALGTMIVSALINEVMARLKIHYGKKENSISLLSDGIHSRVDVYTSLAVLAGLILSRYWIYVDSIMAFLIGVYIIKESFKLGKEATDSLLDVSAGNEIDEKIRNIAKENNIEISDLRTQKKGSIITANLEVKLPGNINVEEAANKTNNLRDELINKIDILEYIVIQIKSLDISSGFYKRDFRSGVGWQGKGKYEPEIKQAKGLGTGGICKCPKCSHEQPHITGQPCVKTKCQKCESFMERN